MPLYEYKCTKCQQNTEKIESVSGPHLKKCPHCGGKVESVISAPATVARPAPAPGHPVIPAARPPQTSKPGAAAPVPPSAPTESGALGWAGVADAQSVAVTIIPLASATKPMVRLRKE